MKCSALILTLLAAALLPATASADAVVAPAPGATSLAAGGGYHAWLAPADAPGLRLTVRRPDGTITRPDVPPFTAATPLSIGSAGGVSPGNRALSVVYGRNGDLYRLDLATGRELRVAPPSSTAYREVAGAVQYGSYVFVRRGGARPGIYRYRAGRPAARITSATPSLLAFNGTRVAYAVGRQVVVRRLSGRGQTITFRAGATVRDVVLTRYRVGWLTSGGRVFQSDRFGGSSTPRTRYVAREGRRQLPESTRSIADDGANIVRYLDAEGVKSIVPALF